MTEQEKQIEGLNKELQQSQLMYDSLKELYDRDIADHKLTVSLLAQTKANYESYFNTIDDFLFVLDERGNIIHTNSTVTSRLGYTSDELYGTSVLMIHPPDRRAEAGRIVGEMLQGLAEFCPVPILTKSGVQIPVETKVSTGFWDGKPVIFGVTKDISKVKLSEEKFSKLFHINPSACGLSDLDDFTYVEVNEAFYNLFGFKKGEVIGKTAYELGIMTPEAKETILRKADENGNVTNVLANLRASDGDIKVVLLSSENIFVQDRKYRFTVVHDITEHKKAEEEIRLKNEELVKSNAEKDRFFSIIAHDLRSPFNGFLGLTQILAEDLSNLTMDEIHRFATDLSKSAANLFRLLNNLLDWSQIQKGLIPFVPKVTGLRFLVDESLSMLLESAKSKKIEIVLDIREDMEVYVDINMMQTIFRNLISNAIKFTPKGGKIVLAAKTIPDGSVEISFSDTGIGLCQNMIDHLFRLDGRTNRRGTEGEPSTGLGLILCKEFIEKHKGQIRVESSLGIGSTFYCTLPLKK